MYLRIIKVLKLVTANNRARNIRTYDRSVRLRFCAAIQIYAGPKVNLREVLNPRPVETPLTLAAGRFMDNFVRRIKKLIVGRSNGRLTGITSFLFSRKSMPVRRVTDKGKCYPIGALQRTYL